jgi:hypothetical protein
MRVKVGTALCQVRFKDCIRPLKRIQPAEGGTIWYVTHILLLFKSHVYQLLTLHPSLKNFVPVLSSDF